MKALPRLFVKHQTDQNRIFTVLLIPQMMDLEMYLEMRMITVRQLSCLSGVFVDSLLLLRHIPAFGTTSLSSSSPIHRSQFSRKPSSPCAIS